MAAPGPDGRRVKAATEAEKEKKQETELPVYGVSSLADVDRYALETNPRKHQLFIAVKTSLVDAVAIDARMRAGKPGVAFKVFNPEVVARKVEAEAAMRAAIARITRSIDKAALKIERTREKIAAVEGNLDLGADVVRVGPSIDHRALPHHQAGAKPDQNIGGCTTSQL
ncbi:hypothetical protein ACP70R_030809 [Stipagrostis hirtigluma subsp. patula]